MWACADSTSSPAAAAIATTRSFHRHPLPVAATAGAVMSWNAWVWGRGEGRAQ